MDLAAKDQSAGGGRFWIGASAAFATTRTEKPAGGMKRRKADDEAMKMAAGGPATAVDVE
jgi:hypothetical protein